MKLTRAEGSWGTVKKIQMRRGATVSQAHVSNEPWLTVTIASTKLLLVSICTELSRPVTDKTNIILQSIDLFPVRPPPFDLPLKKFNFKYQSDPPSQKNCHKWEDKEWRTIIIQKLPEEFEAKRRSFKREIFRENGRKLAKKLKISGKAPKGGERKRKWEEKEATWEVKVQEKDEEEERRNRVLF